MSRPALLIECLGRPDEVDGTRGDDLRGGEREQTGSRRQAIEVYETDPIDVADAYLVACAESTDVNRVASFERSIDCVGTVERVEPLAP